MLKEFKDIIPETIEKTTESTPVKKVSETGAGARLVLSFNVPSVNRQPDKYY